jgi:TfoX/Sxy family transcriptional regulator of competence genes
MSAKKPTAIPADKVEAYEKLVATLPGVERKGADNPYTALNGNMFTLLHSPEGRLAIRLPEDKREQFLKKYKTTLFEAYGTVMKEYVAVPDALLKKPRELQPYFAMSLEYAKTLKAKPTKKK